jgi:hypothetical protein
MSNHVGYVYTITNRLTGQVYIGCTAQHVAKRWLAHILNLEVGKHHSKRLQTDWDRYGPTVFDFAIVATTADIGAMRQLEAVLIDNHDQDKLLNAPKVYSCKGCGAGPFDFGELGRHARSCKGASPASAAD